eukprot:6204480-Pleurochrysis_carterae.AAC.2
MALSIESYNPRLRSFKYFRIAACLWPRAALARPRTRRIAFSFTSFLAARLPRLLHTFIVALQPHFSSLHTSHLSETKCVLGDVKGAQANVEQSAVCAQEILQARIRQLAVIIGSQGRLACSIELTAFRQFRALNSA